MQEHIKNGVECEQMKRMKSSATKKTGNDEKKCFCFCFVSLFRELFM